MKQQQLLFSLAQKGARFISYSSFERLCIKTPRFRVLHPFNTWLSIGGMCSDINVTKKIYARVKVISKKEPLSLIILVRSSARRREINQLAAAVTAL